MSKLSEETRFIIIGSIAVTIGFPIIMTYTKLMQMYMKWLGL